MKREFNSVSEIALGYVVKLKKGGTYMCLRWGTKDCSKKGLVGEYYSFIDENDYNGLNHKYNRNKDIIEIYGLPKEGKYCLDLDYVGRPLLWERKEPKKLTVNEVSKLLGFEVEIIGGNSNE